MAGPVAVGLSCFWKPRQGFHDGSMNQHPAPPSLSTTRGMDLKWRDAPERLSRPPICGLPQVTPEPSAEPEKHPGNNGQYPGNTDSPAEVPIGRRELPADDGLAATKSCTTQSTTWNLINGVYLSGSPAVLMR